MSTIYVNAEWNADSVLPEGLVWGENAFATTKEAYMAARNIGGEITIDLTGAGAESLDSTVGLGKAGKDGVYTITGGDINTTSYGLSFADTNTTVNVKDATFKIAKIYVANEGGKFNVDNSVIGSAYYSGNNGGWATAGNGSYTINNSIFGINFNNFTAEELASMPRSASALKEAIAAGTADYVAACANNSGYHFGTAGLADITDSTMMTTWISLIDRAEMNLDNSVLYYGGGVSIGAGQIDSSLGQYNSNEIGWDAQIWWNPPLSSAEGFREGEVATMNVVDSIVRNIGGGNGTEGGHFQVGGSFTNGFDESITGECAGVLNIINSDFSTSVYGNDGNVIAKDYDMLVVKSNGVVNVTDSKLTTSKLINDGVFNVNGESTLSIGTLTGTYIRFEDAEIVGDSNIGGNICTFGDFKVGADLTYKQGNFYGNTTIESGATLDGSITIVGSGAEFALADGSNLNSRFFNIMGTADVAGNVVLKHSDPRQKCLQVFDGGIININAGADFTIDGHCGIVKEGGNLNIEGGNLNIIRWDGRDIGGILYNDGTVTVNSGNVDIYEVINNNIFTVAGESTLNIAALSGNTIDLLDGAIVKDSTVGGEVFVAGNVTFRGDNTFNMIYDFGVLTDYYGTTAPMEWTVEKGASLTLNKKDRYGLGYGDNVTINGSIADAKAAREDLSDVKLSFFTHGIVTMESKGWNQTSYFTVNDAYAVIGSNNSFGNKAGNYGGTFFLNFNNSVIDISRFSLYEAISTSYYTFTDSDVYVSGAFMTADADSVVTLENTNISVNGNGTDVSNTNAGTLNVIDKSNLTYNGQNFVNNGTVLVENSSFTADSFTNNGSLTVDTDSLVSAKTLTGSGSITIDATDFAGVVKVVDVTSSSFTGSIEVVGNEDAYYTINSEGDIVVSTIPTEKVYFDYTWTEYDFSENIEGDKYFGINAFNKFDTSGVDTSKGWSNLMVLPENTTEIVLTAGNDDASYGMLRPTQSLTVYTEGEGYAVIDRFVNVVGNLTFAEGSKVKVLTVNGSSGANNQGDGNGGQSKVTVNGELYFANATSGNKAVYLWGMSSTPGYIVINAGGKLITEAGNVENHGTIEVKGYMELGSAGDAPKLAGVGASNGGWNGHLIVDGVDGEGKLVVKHNQINFGGGNTSQPWEEPAGACTVTVKNGGVIETAAVSFRNGAKNTLTLDNGSLIFNDGSAYGVDYSGITPRYFDNQGVINISNNGKFDAANRNFVNDGTIAVNSASFAAGSMANNGAFTVTGEGTLNVNKVTGNAIQVLDGTVITDSYIGGEVHVISGENTWTGSNEITGIFSVGYYNYGGDITTNITGEFTNTNMLSWNTNDCKTVINIGTADGERTVFNGGQIGEFENTEINIVNTDLIYHYTFIRGNFNVKDSSLNIGKNGVNTYFAGDSVTVVDNSEWTVGSYATIGSYGGNYMAGNADVTLNGSTMNAGNLEIFEKDGKTVKLTVNNSTVNATTQLNVSAGAEVYLNAGAVVVTPAFNNNGTVYIKDTAFTDVINNEGNVYLRGTVTVDADAFNGKAAVADTRASLNITDWQGSETLANINVGVSQIKTINGQNVFTYGENAYYFINTDKVLYTLTAENSQVNVSKVEAFLDFKGEIVASQIADSYNFTFSVEAENALGAVTYTLSINGEIIESNTTGKFTWSNAAYAEKLENFTYTITAVDEFNQVAKAEKEFKVTDYTAPVAAGFTFDADGNLTFAVTDNAGIASVKVNGQDAEFVDGKYSFGNFGNSQTYIVEVTDINGITSQYSGIVVKPVETDAQGNTTVNNGTDSENKNEVALGDVKSDDSVGSLYIGSNSDVTAESISADSDKSIEIVVSTNSDLTVGQNSDKDMTSVSDLATGSDVKIKANVYKATAEDDSFSLGMDSTAEFSAFDMLDGYDDAYVGVNAELTVNGDMDNVEKLTLANGAKVSVEDYTTASGIVKVGMNAVFTAEAVSGVAEMTLSSKAAVNAGSFAGLNKLTVGSGASFNAENVEGTTGNDVFTFSSNSESIFDTLAFGDGIDRLVMNSGASLLITDEITGLERISGNKSNTIYTTDAAMVKGIAGSNLINIVEISAVDYTAVKAELAATDKDFDEYIKDNYAISLA